MLHCSRNVPFMLMKLSNYAQNVPKCVTDLESVEQKVTFYGDFLADSSWLLACMIGLIFAVHANGRSAMDQLIAVMNWLYWMSLDSVGCSLSLDSLTETWVTWLVAVVLLLQLAPSSSHILSKLCPPNRRSPNTALTQSAPSGFTRFWLLQGCWYMTIQNIHISQLQAFS